MSIDPHVAVASAQAELVAPDRIYVDYLTMAAAESERSDGIDAVIIATPPQTHCAIAVAFLEQGIDVICEKPMTLTVSDAEKLAEVVRRNRRLFLLTHCYTGYPMVRQARAMIAAGAIGRVSMIDAELAQGEPGMMREPENPRDRQWRFRKDAIGRAGILLELGSHIHNLVSYVTGCEPTAVAARLDTIAAGREVYDNAYLTSTFTGGAAGRLWNSYVAAGNGHGMALRIYGEEGSLF
jgi:predicted dehydrogenase